MDTVLTLTRAELFIVLGLGWLYGVMTVVTLLIGWARALDDERRQRGRYLQDKYRGWW